LLNIHLNSSKFFSFIKNNVVRYYLTNCKTNLQIEKQNLQQIWERKCFRKRLLSAGSGSAEAEAEAVRVEAEAEALRNLPLPPPFSVSRLEWFFSESGFTEKF
jgi:hypothetical protein